MPLSIPNFPDPTSAGNILSSTFVWCAESNFCFSAQTGRIVYFVHRDEASANAGAIPLGVIAIDLTPTGTPAVYGDPVLVTPAVPAVYGTQPVITPAVPAVYGPPPIVTGAVLGPAPLITAAIPAVYGPAPILVPAVLDTNGNIITPAVYSGPAPVITAAIPAVYGDPPVITPTVYGPAPLITAAIPAVYGPAPIITPEVAAVYGPAPILVDAIPSFSELVGVNQTAYGSLEQSIYQLAMCLPQFGGATQVS